MHTAPTEPPQMVAIVVLSSTSIMASWQTPTVSEQNGIIRQYALAILDTASGEETTLVSFGTSVNATGLKPFTSYSCKVAAFTVAYGPYSGSVNVTTQQDGKDKATFLSYCLSLNVFPYTVPSAPPELFNASSVDSSSLLLEWNPPSPGTENGDILYYTVTLTEQETGTTSQNTSVDNYIMIYSLHPYYTYVVMVAAVTVAGTGPTNTLTIEMPEDGKQAKP